MKTDKYIGMEINGYRWFSHNKGVHSFQRRTTDGYRWELVQCTEDQLHNGDIEFMTKHGWTLSKERIRDTYKLFKK